VSELDARRSVPALLLWIGRQETGLIIRCRSATRPVASFPVIGLRAT
jgi:hypothetical protein